MDEPVWNVKIEKAYLDLDFAFDSAEEAEAFARTAVESYQPDKEKFSVSVNAVMADGVVADVKEDEDA